MESGQERVWSLMGIAKLWWRNPPWVPLIWRRSSHFPTSCVWARWLRQSYPHLPGNKSTDYNGTSKYKWIGLLGCTTHTDTVSLSEFGLVSYWEGKKIEITIGCLSGRRNTGVCHKFKLVRLYCIRVNVMITKGILLCVAV